jgi:hypothetical protein
MYLVQVSLLFIGQHAWFGTFLQVSPLLPIGKRIVKIFYLNAGGIRPIQRQLFLVNQQDNALLLIHNYTPLVICRNYKNNELILSSQCKLALTARNTLCITASGSRNHQLLAAMKKRRKSPNLPQDEGAPPLFLGALSE